MKPRKRDEARDAAREALLREQLGADSPCLRCRMFRVGSFSCVAPVGWPECGMLES